MEIVKHRRFFRLNLNINMKMWAGNLSLVLTNAKWVDKHFKTSFLDVALLDCVSIKTRV